MATFMKVAKKVGLICLALCLCCAIAACNNGQDTTTTQEPTVGQSQYTVQVQATGTLDLTKVDVYVYTDETMDELETVSKLDANGTMSFTALTSDSYVAVLMGVPVGYPVEEYYTFDSTKTAKIQLNSAVITDQEKPADKVYQLGDVVYDFSITAADGTTYKLSELLQEKDAVVLNFWYLNCTPCKLEFPFLELAYRAFSDNIEVLGINCEDGDDPSLLNFADEYDLTFPLAIGDKDYWYPAAYSACPTTMVIDRYGVVVYLHTGYFDEAAPFAALFRTVSGENYQQTLVTDVEEIITEDDYITDGSAERPFEIGGTTGFDLKLTANGKVHYNIYRLENVRMRIENPNVSVIIDGETYQPVDGVIDVQVSCPDTMTPLHVVFCNQSNSSNKIHVEFIFREGHINNPLELVLGDNTIFVPDVNMLGQYYLYTATTDGTLKLTVEEITEGTIPTISVYNQTTGEAVYQCELDEQTGKYTISVRVNAGDQVQLVIGASIIDPNAVIHTATIKALASIIEGEGSGIIDGKMGYSVTVVDQDGNPMADVRVNLTLSSGQTTLVTDSNGVASIRLVSGAYPLQLEVPVGYVADVTQFLLSPGVSKLTIVVKENRSFSVKLEMPDGTALSNQMVLVYADAQLEELLFAITTDENGIITFMGVVDATYYVTFDSPEGTVAESYYETAGEETVITLAEEIGNVDPDVYLLGDVVEDFTVIGLDGTAYTLSSLLQQKQFVVLTFWQSSSEANQQHMACLQNAYAQYGDTMAVLALNPVDVDDAQLQMLQQYGVTFPVAGCEASWTARFQLTDYPTTVVIDREGRISLVHTGEITDEAVYETMVTVFTAEDYTHTPFATLEALLEHKETVVPPEQDPEDNPEDEPVDEPQP